MEYDELKKLINKFNSIEQHLTVINSFINSLNLPVNQELSSGADQLFLAVFKEKAHEVEMTPQEVDTPFGPQYAMMAKPVISYDGGFEVKIKHSTSMRIAKMLKKDLMRQRAQIKRQIKNLG